MITVALCQREGALASIGIGDTVDGVRAPYSDPSLFLGSKFHGFFVLLSFDWYSVAYKASVATAVALNAWIPFGARCASAENRRQADTKPGGEDRPPR